MKPNEDTKPELSYREIQERELLVREKLAAAALKEAEAHAFERKRDIDDLIRHRAVIEEEARAHTVTQAAHHREWHNHRKEWEVEAHIQREQMEQIIALLRDIHAMTGFARHLP